MAAPPEIAEAALRGLDELRTHPAVTADGVRIRLDANLEIADEVGRVRDAGAEEIELYRSEFLLDATSRVRHRRRASRHVSLAARSHAADARHDSHVRHG